MTDEEKKSEEKPKTSEPFSTETLFAYALPEALKRKQIDDATRIFKKSDLEEILKSGKPKKKKSNWLLPVSIFIIIISVGIIAFEHFM